MKDLECTVKKYKDDVKTLEDADAWIEGFEAELREIRNKGEHHILIREVLGE